MYVRCDELVLVLVCEHRGGEAVVAWDASRTRLVCLLARRGVADLHQACTSLSSIFAYTILSRNT